MDETSELLLNTAERLFGTHCDGAVVDAASRGEWPGALWSAVEEAGLAGAMLPETAGGVGLSAVEALQILRVAARFAAPIPLAETMLAGWLASGAGLSPPAGPLSVAPVRAGERITLARAGEGWRLSGTATRIPWGRNAAALVVLGEAEGEALVACVEPSGYRVTPAANVAGEPRDTVSFDGATLPAAAVAPAPAGTGRPQLRAMGAAMRTAQIAGALSRTLDTSVAYAQARVQFGRPIGRFQAVQHNLAVLAGQAAAAGAAADMAAEAAAGGLAPVVIGAAKTRAGEAASQGAAIGHQVHGAIGFTQEYELQRATRRLWSWRDEFGNEAEWGLVVGRAAAAAGGDGLWAAITAV